MAMWLRREERRRKNRRTERRNKDQSRGSPPRGQRSAVDQNGEAGERSKEHNLSNESLLAVGSWTEKINQYFLAGMW